eukprot:TRINITY_DN53059_c0_g1_i2.p1 TRINITY_DN53059_c0_g1~~TRINITY_DN53059_c0_g1_i2.p1  ORF type:complete len:231 (+),score=78.19 TRINITY_DN53059_c0_g1_i2:703-1395(+)
MPPKEAGTDQGFVFGDLMDFVPVPMFFKGRDGRYQAVNQLFADQIIGLPKKQILGRDFSDLRGRIPADLAGTYHTRDEELMQQGGAQVYESEVLCADGQRRTFAFHKAVVNGEDGAGVGIVGVMLDISARCMLQEQVVANEKMQAVIQTTGAVKHELNQPLQVISGMVELCSQEPGLSEAVRQYLEIIQQAVQRSVEILRKLDRLKAFRTKEYLPAAAAEILDLEESSRE